MFPTFNKIIIIPFHKPKRYDKIEVEYIKIIQTKEIKSIELEAKILDIDVASQVLHEHIKILIEEMKMLIIQLREEDSKNHVDKQQPEAHVS